MGTIFSYSLGASVFLLFGYLVYKLFLSAEKQPTLNRVCLLALYGVSLAAIPLLALDWNGPSGTFTSEVDLGGVIVTVAPSATDDNSLTIPNLLLIVYLVGMGATAAFTIFGIVRLFLMFKHGTRTRQDGYTLVMIPFCDVPFSFGNFIVAGKGESAENMAMMISHESAHLRYHHWYDLVLAQAVCILLWYNPVAWLMREELRRLHEYQADASVISAGHNPYHYQLLLIKKAAGRRLQSFANSLNHSNLSKRITMMYKSQNRAVRSLRSLALLPAVALAAIAVVQPAIATTIKAAGSGNLFAERVESTSLVDNKINEKSPDAQQGPVTSVGQESVNKASDFTACRHVSSADKDDPAQQIKELPQFPGGESALLQFLAENVIYPKDAMEAGEEGKVVVQFIVGKDGTVSSGEILRGQTESLNKEALRVISQLPPFKPGLNSNGEAVTCLYMLPVSFKLMSSDIETIKINGSDKEVSTSSKSPALFVNGELFKGDINSITTDRIESVSIVKNNPDYPEGIIQLTLKQ